MKKIYVMAGLMSFFFIVSPLSGASRDSIARAIHTGTYGGVERGAMTITEDKAWGNIDYRPFKLINNTWGAPDEETLSSAVYMNQGKNFGWYWNREAPVLKQGHSCVQPIYPSLRAGGNPWERPGPGIFPIKLGDLKSLDFDVSYNYPIAPTGTYDLAYDVLLTDTDQPSINPIIKAEVMIWIHGSARQPSHTLKGDYSNGHNDYQLYSWVQKDGRQYYSFITKGEGLASLQHAVDAKKLIDYLGLNPGWYIHGVELGNEVWKGSGKIEITSFVINVNGHQEQISPMLPEK
jgi:hypothetical protein